MIFLITSKCFITVSIGMVRAIICHQLNTKTNIISVSEESRLSVAIHITMMLRDWNVVKEVTWANKGSYTFNVSDLGCTLTTPTVIDFGPQPANATNGQLLATRTDNNLAVYCRQNTNPMSATLSLSAGINPIYFSGDSYQVNLLDGENKPGAYVTMSVDINGTQKDIPFNREPIFLGNIDAASPETSFSYPITYSLYSRGTGVTGKIKGNAELSVILR
ncbi:hypothetical protein H9I30_16805 [Morganella morganii]|uniref:hypothetical protein n=1 Tax=Morganella morganii TaxID=582 RepID=UPI00165102F5|nr:hypothetical protein [Morganella morganii]MBC6659655.1 hypothetical protein [Morganella morganii]